MKHFIVSFMICVPFLLSAQTRTIEVIVTDTVQREVDFIICEVQIDSRNYGYYEEAIEEVEEAVEEVVEAVEEEWTEEYVYESYGEKIAKLQAYIKEHNYEFVNPSPENRQTEVYNLHQKFFIKVKNINEFIAIHRDIEHYASVELYNIQFKPFAEYDKILAQKLIKQANAEAAITAEVMGKSLGEIIELSEIGDDSSFSSNEILLSIISGQLPGFHTSDMLPSYFSSSFPNVYTKSFKVKFELK